MWVNFRCQLYCESSCLVLVTWQQANCSDRVIKAYGKPDNRTSEQASAFGVPPKSKRTFVCQFIKSEGGHQTELTRSRVPLSGFPCIFGLRTTASLQANLWVLVFGKSLKPESRNELDNYWVFIWLHLFGGTYAQPKRTGLQTLLRA